MYFCLLIIFSDSHKLIPKYLRFQGVFHLRLVINQLQLPILDNYKKELLQPKTEVLLQFKLYMFLRTILLIQLQLPLLRILMLPLYFPELLLNWVFIQLQILWIPVQKCLILILLDKNIMTLLEEFKNFFKITKVFRILLLFWVWMN